MANRDGAAKRRRDRRLRMHWRHKQLTLQMALAATLHHNRDVGPVTYNALRSQRIVRAGVWGARVELCGHESGTPTPHPSWSSSASSKKNPGVAAGQDAYLVRAAGASSAAHRGPDCRGSPFGAFSR